LNPLSQAIKAGIKTGIQGMPELMGFMGNFVGLTAYNLKNILLCFGR